MLLGSSINPVIEDSLKAALAEHKDNIDVYTMVKEGEYRDSDNIPYNYEECSVVHWKKQIEESKVPMLVLASWMDAGTAEGTIQRLEHFSNPQKILLMATAHGGWCNASPFAVQDTLYYPKPLMQEQTQLELDFLDHYVKGIDKGVEEWPLIKYYNLGEEEFRTSNEWPIAGTREINYYFQKEGGLTTLKPTEPSGSDDYKVDFSVYTSKKNRWTTQMEGPVFNLNNRNEMDERMLVYTSEPAKEDIQITGTPVVSLQMSSTHTDGAVLVYLEDVDENGNSTYITEGGLRLIHRAKLADTSSSLNLHSFNEADAKLMTPYVVDDVEFKLWPTSVLIKKGHSIRIAIAGADKSVFDRLPKNGTPVINIQRSSTQLSFVTLPVVE
jgi:putative CocE/NonD family hydrolase